MKKMKKLSSILLCLVLVFSVFICTPVMSSAADASITAAVQGTYTQSAAAQDITVRISVNDLNTPYCAFGIEGGMVMPDGFVLKSVSTSNTAQPMTENDYETDATKPDYSKVGYMDTNAADTIPGNTYYDVVITAPADAKGDYEITFKDIQISNNYGGNILITAESVTAAFSISESVDGYVVTQSSSKTEVAKGGDIDIYLDVSNEETFNAFYGQLEYNKNLVSYNGVSGEANGFTVADSAEAGILTISRTGDPLTISSDAHELALSFTANTAGSAKFDLSVHDVQVDFSANAEGSDAIIATVNGSPLTVTILETYTITFAGGEGATGKAPAMDPVTAGTTITLPANTFTKEGYTFAGWNDGEATYQADAQYVMTANNVSFTAQWTANTTPPNVTGTEKSDYVTAGNGYILIEATIDQDGYIPTYDGNDMVKVGDKYYYAIEGSDYDAKKLNYRSDSVEAFDKTADVNLTGKIDINDAQFVYNICNGTKPTTDAIKKLIRADANSDEKVTTADCAYIVGYIE